MWIGGCDCNSSDTKADAGPKGPTEEEKKQGTEKLTARCDKLGKACGEEDKHKTKITEECKGAIKGQVDKGCADKVIAVYDCYEKDVCVKGERIWAFDDFRVLTTRNKKCVEQLKASNDCIAAK